MSQEQRIILFRTYIELCKSLEKTIAIESVKASDKAVPRIWRAIQDFLVTARKLDLLRAQANSDEGILTLSEEHREYLRSSFSMSRKKYEELLAQLAETQCDDVGSGAGKDEASNPVWRILASGLDFWQQDDSGQFPEINLEETEELLFSEWFRPDDWLTGLRELQPILGRNAGQRIPGQVRLRLGEISQLCVWQLLLCHCSFKSGT